MTHRPFGLPRLALLATALALIWFQPPLLSAGAAPRRLHSDTLALFHSATLSQAPSQTGAMTEIRALFAEYIRLHSAKKIDEWQGKMFLPEALCVQTLNDGKVHVFQIAELAQIIAAEAKSLDEQHEVFEDVRIEVYGNAAQYAATWRLFQNGKQVGKGRAFFSLVKKDGAWRIASLVWYRD